MLNRYLVKDKYTYEKIWDESSNYNFMPDFYVTEAAETVFDGALSRKSETIGVERIDFSRLSGLKAEAENDFNITFVGENDERFLMKILPEKSKLYSLLAVKFIPKKLIIESETVQNIKISGAFVWNTFGEWGGQAHFYETNGEASLFDKGASMSLILNGAGSVETRSCPKEQGSPYTMPFPRRNTIFMVLKNRAGAEAAKVSFTTDEQPDFCDENSVTLALAKDGLPHAYYFNFSECPDCHGRLDKWRLSADGKGEIEIVRYSYEQEKSLAENIAIIDSCIADVNADTVTVKGTIDTKKTAKYSKLSLYASTMADDEMLGRRYERTGGKTLLKTVALPRENEFSIVVPFKMGKVTLLPYELLLFAEGDGCEECLAPRFYVENYECLDKNEYSFGLPDFQVNVLERGALGDGFTDDTEAIQSAIDEVNKAGGGRVLLPGADGIYGRRYIVTNLLIRDNVEIHFGDGAILWQSPIAREYPYVPEYGHDGVIPGINWTHNLHVSNLPLIQGANSKNIKITGRGQLRMMDVGSEEGVGMPGYAAGCPRRIHVVPLGLFLCDNIECRDFEVVRSNNYNTDFNKCRYIYIGNVRCHEVKCVSGDGYGVGSCKHVHVNRSFLQSNDDGIVMTVHYFDPRGLLWWTNIMGEDNSVDDIKTTHSYINSGGGKCLAFITWGTNDPCFEKEEIRNIVAYGNVLVGVNPVGAWHDNPYNGKQPFDNTETDDYSPVKNVRIFDNVYLGNCSLGPIQATNFISDCGVLGASDFQNGSFTLGGLANWTTEGDCDTVIFCGKEKGRLRGNATLCEGLHIEPGRHTFTCELMTSDTGAELFAKNILTGEIYSSQKFVCKRAEMCSLVFDVCANAEIFVGVQNTASDGFAIIDKCVLKSETDSEKIKNSALCEYSEKIGAIIDLDESIKLEYDSGKTYLRTNGLRSETELKFKEEKETFSLELAIKTNEFDASEGEFGYGIRFAEAESENTYRELRYNYSDQTLILKDVYEGKETELYHRDNFFFTSLDFHILKLTVDEKDTVIWVDGSLYGSVPTLKRKGKIVAFFRDMDATIDV